MTIRSLDPALVEVPGQSVDDDRDRTPARPNRCASSAVARGVGTRARAMTVTLGDRRPTRSKTTLPVSAPAPVETTAAFGETDGRGDRTSRPAGRHRARRSADCDVAVVVDGARRTRRRRALPRGLSVRMRRAEGVGRARAAARGRSRQRVFDGPASRRPTIGTRATSLSPNSRTFSARTADSAIGPGRAQNGNVYLTSYVLHVMKVGERPWRAPPTARSSRTRSTFSTRS